MSIKDRFIKAKQIVEDYKYVVAIATTGICITALLVNRNFNDSKFPNDFIDNKMSVEDLNTLVDSFG